MKHKIIVLVLALSVLFIQGCGLLATAASAAAAYAISQAFD